MTQLMGYSSCCQSRRRRRFGIPTSRCRQRHRSSDRLSCSGVVRNGARPQAPTRTKEVERSGAVTVAVQASGGWHAAKATCNITHQPITHQGGHRHRVEPRVTHTSLCSLAALAAALGGVSVVAGVAAIIVACAVSGCVDCCSCCDAGGRVAIVEVGETTRSNLRRITHGLSAPHLDRMHVMRLHHTCSAAP